MERVALDSSAAIEILQGTPLGAAIGRWAADRQVLVPTIAAFELLQNPAHRFAAQQLLNEFSALPFDSSAAQTAVDIQDRLLHAGKSLNKLDLFIAATALANGLAIAACDRDFLRVPGLELKLF